MAEDFLEAQVNKESFCQEAVDGEVNTKLHVSTQPQALSLTQLKLDLEIPKKEDKPTELVIENDTKKVGGKKLLIFDLNGLLIHKVHCMHSSNNFPQNRAPDAQLLYQKVYKRPYADDFLKFCIERFEVAIWSSARDRNMDAIMDQCFGGLKMMPLFIWDQSYCSDYGFDTLEKKGKPLFFKDLKKVWNSYHNSEKGPFTSKNTLLIDDKPCKSLLNPPNSGIFPDTYDVHDPFDNALDPKGELATWLNGLSHAEDVPSYVATNPFGQPAINEAHPDWPFYSSILRHPTVAAHVITV